VALKFLPEEASHDPGLLERFRGEVRISRKVSHPNVCRVYDVGDVDGQTFFTMEYVDGEDLASLLRRIGRLPHDKALDTARQLCAGLAAAHSKGVLHRDLKPANIMLDGRGQAVITDFGLAALAEQAQGPDVRSGTPAYMAPEQLAGKEVTEKSDIYSLGLVLYEIFTGRRAFTAESLAELVRSRASGTISRPSSFVKDLDPLVERVILHCLEAEPARRPVSALAVAAALPGGDPLAAALAAGETPSPQMVAAAGQIEGMKPRLALLCIASCVLGLIASVVLINSNSAIGKLPLEMPPEVLSQKARDTISQLGYDPRAVDSAVDFDYDQDFQRWAEKNDKPRPQWNKILSEQPPLLSFTFRQSPRYLTPLDLQVSLTPGVVTFSDPATTIAGMINLREDTEGRLLFFQALPPEMEKNASPAAKAVDWNPLFAAAGLDRSQLQTVAPQWTSLADSDERAAWTGQWPGSGRPLRVEAAAWHGKPVFFRLVGPWTRPERMRLSEQTRGSKLGEIAQLVLVFLIIAGSALLSRRKYKHGKGDQQGAFRLAKLIFAAQMAVWVSYSHFVPGAGELQIFAVAVSTALLSSLIVWVLYMSLEPFVRKLWPHSIISWTRLITGQVRDALVGRDVMFGVMLGLIWVLVFQARLHFGITRFGEIPQINSSDYLLGAWKTLGTVLAQVPNGILGTMLFFLVLIGLRYILRNQWAAGVGFVTIYVTLKVLGSSHPGSDTATWLIIYGIAAFALVRFGLITLAVAVFVANTMLNVPVTLDFSRWYATAAIIPPLGILALGIWGFYNALGGQKLIKGEMLD
ncbi:MAG TPA: serine/threonine-protein kinase, partial [Candidatus Angelobacter sp.]|nr:serine/threonine-protein kinase [Candidatus Angelobacter sp.]